MPKDYLVMNLVGDSYSQERRGGVRAIVARLESEPMRMQQLDTILSAYFSPQGIAFHGNIVNSLQHGYWGVHVGDAKLCESKGGFYLALAKHRKEPVSFVQILQDVCATLRYEDGRYKTEIVGYPRHGARYVELSDMCYWFVDPKLDHIDNFMD